MQEICPDESQCSWNKIKKSRFVSNDAPKIFESWDKDMLSKLSNRIESMIPTKEEGEENENGF